mgnify:CR=1 FL=1
MTEHQQKLLKTGGPVFEFGPGWGAKTKKWFKKYVLAADCPLCRNTRYILIIGLVFIIFFGPRLELWMNPKKQAPAQAAIIKVLVQKGDSKTKLARRALVDYLVKSPEELTGGQKIFIENILSRKITTGLKVNGNIEFATEDIRSALNESKTLTPFQLQKWEEYSKRVSF